MYMYYVDCKSDFNSLLCIADYYTLFINIIHNVLCMQQLFILCSFFLA